MATESITVHIDDVPVELTLRSAKKIDGIYRSELKLKAAKMEVDEARKMVAFYLWATCVACVKEPEKYREMSFESFLASVDEADMDEWVKLAYKLNPQWTETDKLISALSAEQEKKTGTSSNGSTEPTGEPAPSLPISQDSKT